jgi:dTDP-4-amino-4,6-dideoxygalactose transaminase
MKIPLLDLSWMHEELRDELSEAWRRVSSSSKFIGGEFVDRFEAEWAAYCQTNHCVGVSSGTTALQLALTGLGIGPGDEVIVPTNTFFGTVVAVLASNATPVFVDVDSDTLLMTAKGIEQAISPRTAAVIVVHLYGQPANMDEIRSVTDRAGLFLIEDAAQAHGATWRGKKAGSLSHVGCFSFYPGKNLGAFGDAGAIVTNDSSLADRIRSLGNYGRSRGQRYEHDHIGGNHRLDGLQAAILSVKLTRLDAWNAKRRLIADWYRSYLATTPLEMTHEAAGASSNYHLFVVQSRDRKRLREYLHAHDIETSIHYPIPCHKQRAMALANNQCHPVAERAAERIISLPMGPHLTEIQVKRVAEVIGQALDHDGSAAAKAPRT